MLVKGTLPLILPLAASGVLILACDRQPCDSVVGPVEPSMVCDRDGFPVPFGLDRELDSGQRKDVEQDSRLDDHETRIVKLEAEVSEIKDLISDLVGKLSDLRRDFEASLVRILSVERQSASLRSEFDDSVARLDYLASELSSLGEDVSVIRDDVSRYRRLGVSVSVVGSRENGVSGDDCFASLGEGDVCEVVFYADVSPAGAGGSWMIGFSPESSSPIHRESLNGYRATVENVPPSTTVTAVFCLDEDEVGGAVCDSDSFTTGSS